MSEIYNILKEPWLHVIDLDGKLKNINLYECLINAHKYKRICENNKFPILRRLQQRLIEAFVIDIFEIDDEDVLIDIFKSNCFDKNKIDDYFEMCKNSGISFDLFDENRPFLQTDKITYEKLINENGGVNSNRNKNRVVSVASIDPKAGSGLNKVFFTQTPIEDYFNIAGAKDNRTSFYDDVYDSKYLPENAYVAKFEDYLNLLLMRHCISGMGGGGYKAGLACFKNTIPNFYQIDILGDKENLFKSILFNIGILNSNNDLGIPMWRWSTYEDGLNKINSGNNNLSHLTGLFFPSMYIFPDFSSVNKDKKTIGKIYKTGINYKKELLDEAREYWLLKQEPSVVAIKDNSKNTNDDFILKSALFTGTNRAWMDIKYFGKTGSANASLKTFISIENIIDGVYSDNKDEAEMLEFTAYYMVVDMAEYHSQGRYSCAIPNFLIYDEIISDITYKFIEYVNKNEYLLKKDIIEIYKTLYEMRQNSKMDESTINNLTNQFLRYCEGLFKFNFMESINNVYVDKQLSYQEKIEQIKLIFEDYKKEISNKKFLILKSIPIPYGKTLIFKELLLKKKEKAKKKGA